ncbi:MAG: hypothetical protein R3232_12940, partial [Clostridia bacterium]|nr:hypothetical protein [Clostridia bacterium]
MKKATAIILIALIAMIPAVVSSQDNTPLIEIYTANDILLANNIEHYYDLLENREDRLEMYEGMRTRRSNTFYTAQAGASKENGIIQVDVDIENALDSIKSRKAWLLINFRKKSLSLHNLKKSTDDAWISYTKTRDDYLSAKSSYSAGFISRTSLLLTEY